MKFAIALLGFMLAGQILGYRPLQPQVHRNLPIKGDAGEALFLTPYIESGDIETGRQLAKVVDPLVGLEENETPESYSGFITVNKAADSQMFFWFFPAQNNPETAPVVIWLQGGPGGSSMFGLLKLHGPILTYWDEDYNIFARPNEHTWNKNANMLYIDNPVGAGFSYSNELPTSEDDVATALYEFLIQWYTLFPMYQPNDFYAFGESYAGKMVPSIAKRIHEQNSEGAPFRINLKGIGLGDGFTSPPDSAVYGEFLYQLGLVDETLLADLLQQEQQMKNYAANGQWEEAWEAWNNEFGQFLSEMSCPYYYEATQCDFAPIEDNYEEFLALASVRKAIHVGDKCFGCQSGAVYYSMIDDFMRSERETVEFLLEQYRVLIYNGNLDIICNHSGVLNMFAAMTNWSGKEEYDRTGRTVFKVDGDTAGYLKSVDKLKLIVIRNAGHMVPMSQPRVASVMFEQFMDGSL